MTQLRREVVQRKKNWGVEMERPRACGPDALHAANAFAGVDQSQVTVGSRHPSPVPKG
jgi:hypothetical protein